MRLSRLVVVMMMVMMVMMLIINLKREYEDGRQMCFRESRENWRNQ